MRRFITAAALAAAIALPMASAKAENFHANLNGFNEIGVFPPGETGAILTDGRATLMLNLNRQAQTATYTLKWSNLTSPITQSHIHFGKVHVPGQVIVFLCADPTKVPEPAGTPVCTGTSGTVTGTLSAGNVLAQPTQNIKAGDFDALEDALESSTAYANLHTVNFPAGEVRGQVVFGIDDEN
jgi:hypothetical protein